MYARGKKVFVDYHKNENKMREIPLLNEKRHGLARWWHSDGKLFKKANYKNGHKHGFSLWWWCDGSIFLFECWHKNTLMVDFEFAFVPKAKAVTPEPNKPIFSTNQFLELCQRK